MQPEGQTSGSPFGTTNALRFCEQLYAVVVGLGLALAADQVVSFGSDGVPVAVEHLPLFVAYLGIAFPLAHGAVRYLDLTYIEHRMGPVPKARAITDVLLDGVRMWWLIVLALYVSEPTVFAVALVLLLVTGAIRGFLPRLVGRLRPSELERNLNRVDLAMLSATALVLLIALVGFDGAVQDRLVRIGLLVAGLCYPLAMYISLYPYFFETSDRAAPDE